MAGQRLASLLAQTPGHQITLAAFHSALDQMTWQVYDVRRAVLPKPGDPGKTGRAAGWLRIRAHGTRAAMVAEVHRLAAAEGARLTAEDGIERARLRRRGEFLPAADWFLVAAHTGRRTTKAPGFAAAWPIALAGTAQGELFAEPLHDARHDPRPTPADRPVPVPWSEIYAAQIGCDSVDGTYLVFDARRCQAERQPPQASPLARGVQRQVDHSKRVCADRVTIQPKRRE